MAADYWEEGSVLEGGVGLDWPLNIWELFPDTKKSHVYSTKQIENVDS